MIQNDVHVNGRVYVTLVRICGELYPRMLSSKSEVARNTSTNWTVVSLATLTSGEFSHYTWGCKSLGCKYFCGALVIARFLNPCWNVVSFCWILQAVNITRSCQIFYCDLYRYQINSIANANEGIRRKQNLTPTLPTYALLTASYSFLCFKWSRNSLASLLLLFIIIHSIKK